MNKWKNENDVNYYVKEYLDKLELKKGDDYQDENNMSDYLKQALNGFSKTKNKNSNGIPDFHIEKYKNNHNQIIPIIIENKLGSKKHIYETKEGIKQDDKSISGFALNGAIYYCRGIVASKKYHEAVAIGISGDDSENILISVYYIYGYSENSYKLMSNYNTLDFLENAKSFKKFYEEATLTEKEKHDILIDSRSKLQKYAKELNKLMNDHSINVADRAIYVSGMLLSMQDITGVQNGLLPSDLNGIQAETNRDGIKITNQIKEFLTNKNIPNDKQKLMLGSFSKISIDNQRDIPSDLNKAVAKLLPERASVNKQIFTYIYENIFKSIDAMTGHLDIMGELYSEFLKYALGDGKEIGIVLTPPYVTKMMAQILDINLNDRVMDLATGSAAFLISSMQIMIEQAEKEYAKGSTKSNEKIDLIKSEQLLGVELDAGMYTLATTNMILRGDGSAKIEKGSSFDRPSSLYKNFKPTKLLLNPPFTYEENGMPFIKHGLQFVEKGGRAAIIIQDSAGSGKAISSNLTILKNNTLLASIKMPTDLFQPMAGVQTSIYVFEAGKPHNFETDTVKFIDFRNDGYKRTERSLNEIDSPTKRYDDIVLISKMGEKASLNTNFNKDLWNISEIYVEDLISNKGNDWNFDQHKKIDTVPTIADFKKTVADYLSWEVSQILKNTENEDIDFFA